MFPTISMKYKNPHPAAWRFNASHKKGVDFTWKEICFLIFFPSIYFEWKVCLDLNLHRYLFVYSVYIYVHNHIHRHNCMDIIILLLFTIFMLREKKEDKKNRKNWQIFSFDSFIFLVRLCHLFLSNGYIVSCWFLETNFLTQFNDDVFSLNSSEPLRYVTQCINYIFFFK